MAHFAEIVEGVVVRVVVVDNDILLDEDGNEQESLGAEFLRGLFGEGTVWVQTSYNSNIRGRFAAVGYNYSTELDKFITPRPYPSWQLDATGEWTAPVPRPSENHRWDEGLGQWFDMSKQVDSVTFTLRFTGEEQVAIMGSENPQVQGMFTMLRANPIVRLDSPVTVGGVKYLLQQGYLADRTRLVDILGYDPDQP